MIFSRHGCGERNHRASEGRLHRSSATASGTPSTAKTWSCCGGGWCFGKLEERSTRLQTDWDRDGRALPTQRRTAELPAEGPRRAWLATNNMIDKARTESPSSPPGTLQGRPPPSHSGGRPLFYAVSIKSAMAGRFAPPPIVRAYARCRLLVLRTMHHRLGASRHRRMRALKLRHRPAIPHCNFIIRIRENRHGAKDHMRRSFGSERMAVAFGVRSPALAALGNFPSRAIRPWSETSGLRSVISIRPISTLRCI